MLLLLPRLLLLIFVLRRSLTPRPLPLLIFLIRIMELREGVSPLFFCGFKNPGFLQGGKIPGAVPGQDNGQFLVGGCRTVGGDLKVLVSKLVFLEHGRFLREGKIPGAVPGQDNDQFLLGGCRTVGGDLKGFLRGGKIPGSFPGARERLRGRTVSPFSSPSPHQSSTPPLHRSSAAASLPFLSFSQGIMATTLESQLKTIRLLVQGDSSAPKRPITRPSILFDPKEAADIDLETIFSIAISGLNILIETDERFRCYKNTLFSQKSLDMDREVMTVEENNKINSSISSYLRLLSGYLQLPSAQKTLEYLIRRCKVHIYNVDELVMCILPYHDTHVFVGIVQILDLSKNKIWSFLQGVKSSGAPMPRKTIVQQCLRDVGVLEAVCSYTVVCFCTALIVEIVGSMLSLDNNMVKRVLPLVFASLNSSIHSADYKAGAMMMVSVISSRAALAPGLVQDLIISLAKLAHQEAGEQGDLSWLHMSLMGIINIVQANFSAIDNFWTENGEFSSFSSSDDSCHLALIGLIERIPMTNFIIALVSKLLAICAKGSRKIIASHSPPESGFWAVKILLALDKQYPKELANAVHEFVENPNTKCGDAAFESAGLMFDLGPKLPMEVSNLKLWFTLEHPRAEVRRSALSDLAKAEKEKCNSKKITVNVRESLLRRLHDDDLTVVQSALTVDGLCGLIDPAVFIKALQDITLRCCNILKTGVTRFNAIAYDIAVSCLTRGVNELEKCKASHKEIATIFFPLLLVLPKTWKLNLRALELAKEVDWPFFKSLADNKDLETMKETKVFLFNLVQDHNSSFELLEFERFLETYIKFVYH
ncbi:HEAT repeat-containing protein 1 [Nymphaea thermarum]|nr:HEAT repeat-containing protein 1 [Nymphaea thermarum]